MVAEEMWADTRLLIVVETGRGKRRVVAPIPLLTVEGELKESVELVRVGDLSALVTYVLDHLSWTDSAGASGHLTTGAGEMERVSDIVNKKDEELSPTAEPPH